MRTRTGYSFRTAYGFLPDVMARISTPYAPITDRGSTYGFNRWRKLCEKQDKKPIYGFEVAVTDSPMAKAMSFDHVTLISTESLTPLNAAFELSMSRFRYEPLLTYSDLNALDPSLIVILGRRAKEDLLSDERDWWYAASPSTPPRMHTLAKQRGWRGVACSDNLYPAPEDKAAFQLLLGRSANTQTWPQHILTDDELYSYCDPEHFEERDRIAEMCRAELPKAKLISPERTLTLRELCDQGAKKLGCDLSDEEYAARLDRELGVIEQLGFEDYFFIISDLVNEARKKMFVGPARGSSCGSLVCWLTGITYVDPIKHGLLFERFLDPNRTDLPDIDIDFSDQHREEVFTYLKDKYGRNHVAKLGTVSFLRERAVAKEIGAGLKVPSFKIEPLLNHISDENETLADVLHNVQDGVRTLREFPELEIVGRLEGHPRHHSTHAAGLIVTQEPVHHYVAVDARNSTAEIDKKDAEDLNHLKIDALGLKQLSIFEDCCELLGQPHAWLMDQPLDDQGAFDVLNRKSFSGVFQYNGRAVQQVSSAFNIETFEDMVATTSLARPGPLGAGGTDRWLKIRRGEEQPRYEHPLFEEILGPTQGIVIFQEQVMQAGRLIGDMTWPRVTSLRKAVQYFGGAEGMEEFRDEFLEGASGKGINRDVANKFWDELLTYGSYAFNKSHAVAYSMISYWCCFLKAHHPVEYAAAMLNHEAKPERQRAMLKELVAEGVSYAPVDSEKSDLKWKVTDGKLLGPLTNVKGLGSRTAREYVEARKAGKERPKRAKKLLEDPRTPVDSLSPISELISRLVDLREKNIISEPIEVKDLGERQRRGVMVFLKTIKATPRIDDKTGRTKMTVLCEDDTGEIKVFFNPDKYAEIGSKLLDAGKIGKSVWAVKGTMPEGGGIIFVDMARYLCEDDA